MSPLQSHTVPLERNQVWSGAFASEPYEASWSREAIFFIRALKTSAAAQAAEARVQISPDGIHWCDEGSVCSLPNQTDETTFVKVSHYGGWLRLVGDAAPESSVTVIVHLVLKA